MFKDRFLTWLRVNFWRICLAIYASIFFAFIVFPFLLSLKFVNSFFNFILVNSHNIKLILGISSIIQILVILFSEKIGNFIERLWHTLAKSYTVSGQIVSILLFFTLSTISTIQYSLALLVIWKCLLFFIGNLFFAFLIWELRNLIGWLSSQFSSIRNPIQTYEQPENILTDDPITSPGEDSLDREKFVGDIYKEIVNFPSDSSFVFGLYGGWGEGKTSVLNLLKLKIENNSEFLVLDFKPWYFKDKESILKAFYNQLESTLSKKFIIFGFSRLIKRYLQYISFGINIVGINLRLSNADETAEKREKEIETPEGMKKEIGNKLEELNVKLLIIIDDIDRLQVDEVLQIFSLVKCNADLKNTIFILSFDQIVIEKLLQIDLNSDRQYLEKIVQMPINLPAVPSGNIGNFLIKNIDELLKRINISDDKGENFYKEFMPTYRAYISKFFRTLRHVKRYINGLSATLPAIKSEVNLNDFFILEVIRVFFPSIYNDIWSNRRFYVRVGWEEDPSQLFRKNEEISSKVKEHVESTLKLKEAVGKDKEQGEILLELLKVLFPVKVKNAFEQGNEDYTYKMDTFRVEKRLTHPDCFVKYFILKVPPSELPDERIEKIINTWKTSKGDEKDKNIEEIFFTLQKVKALKEFFSKLRIFKDKIDEDLAVRIIRAIYSNAGKFSKEETEDSWNPEYDEALFVLLQLINDKIDRKKIQGMLKKAINLTPSIPFAVEVVLLCKKDRSGSLYNIYDSIDFEKLADVISGRLKKHFIDEKRDIFVELPEERDWAFVLYQWASDWMTFKGKNKDAVSSYIVSLVKDNAKKFAKFLIHQRRRAPNDTMVFDLKELSQVYNIKEIANLAEKFKSNSDLLDEEKKVLKQFLELYRSNPPAS